MISVETVLLLGIFLWFIGVDLLMIIIDCMC